MLRKVRLYGQLAEFVGFRQLEAELSSVAEAVRMLVANFPAERAELIELIQNAQVLNVRRSRYRSEPDSALSRELSAQLGCASCKARSTNGAMKCGGSSSIVYAVR